MDDTIQLDRFAYHYIDKAQDEPAYSVQEQDLDQLDETIKTFLVDMVAEIWNAPDEGSTRSGNFAEDDPEIGNSDAAPHLKILQSTPAEFFERTKKLAKLLQARTPGTASSGVLGVIRLLQKGPTQENEGDEKAPDKVFVAVLKIRHTDETFVRLLTGQAPQLKVEEVRNLLLKDIQKGALYPHPEKSNYQLKVIDKQAREDPAVYFTKNFLGCIAKKSDEHQIRRIVPTLEKYAEVKEEQGEETKVLSLNSLKVPQVIAELQSYPGPVTTEVLAKKVKDQDLFGPNFQVDDFKNYIDTQSEVGKLDIPAKTFKARKTTGRRFIYTMKNPPYKGVQIIGPPDVLAKIISFDDNKVRFVLETTPNGFDVRYE